MAFFTGTNTGNQYVPGRQYSMAGETYTAQSDGTFKNDRTGRATVGSSNALREAAASGMRSLGPICI